MDTRYDKLLMEQNIQPYSGFLNIYKEKGYTSMDVCAKLRGILGMRKIGHAGTLDPMAEGVLPVALGRATKDVDRIGDGTKTYRAGMLLGRVTDTQDITGQTLSEVEPDPGLITEERIREAALSFQGTYEQLTPMYSARKVNGKKLYEYARAGKEVERKKKTVEILSITVDRIDLPHVELTVHCTKGTYIRTLCHDIGEKLGCGACMESLLRTQVGDFRLEDAVRLSQVEELRDRGEVDSLLSIKTGTAVALGKFDGNHLGHRKLFTELRQMAQEKKLRTCALILDVGSKLLVSPAERRRELLAQGIDYVIELPLNEELMHMGAEEFIQKILLERLSMKAIAAGPDVSFGYRKEGNGELLSALSGKYGYEVRIIEKLRQKSCSGQEDVISSSLIRRELAAGNMERVAQLLGKPYRIIGRVVHGRHLGGPVLGFPTMNLVVDQRQELPPFGVYATRTLILPERGGRKKGKEELLLLHEGISNLGKKPTVSNEADYDPDRVDLETNLFSYEADVYGREICVELLAFIRPEKKFGSLAEVRQQLLERDIPTAKKILANLQTT